MIRLALILALLAAGCAPTNISEWQKAMAGDPASVCVQINTVYGTMRLSRSACTNCRVACNGDGLQVQQVTP